MIGSITTKGNDKRVEVTAINGKERIDIETFALVVPGEDFVVQISEMTDEDCLHSMCAMIEGVLNHVDAGIQPWIKNALHLYANEI